MEIIVKENAEKMLNDKLGEYEFLRVKVSEGGCAGLTYAAEVGREMNDDDIVVLEGEGFRVVSDRAGSKYLDGLVIDYSDELFNGGLKFTNVNTRSTCGCGSSFSLGAFPEIEGGKCTSGD